MSYSDGNDDISIDSSIGSSIHTYTLDNGTHESSGDALRRCNKRAFWMLIIGAVATSIYRMQDTHGQLLSTAGNNYQKHLQQSEGFAFSHKLSSIEEASSRHGGGKSYYAIDDDNLTTNKTGGEVSKLPAPKPMHAAEALQCRESVVAFVINATDVKDECEGLKKAFDKTCSNDATDDEQVQKQNPANRRRRKLSEKLQERHRTHWYLWVYKMARSIHRLYNRCFPDPVQKAFFFSEDEIVGSVWDDSLYLVQNNLECKVHSRLKHKWMLERIEKRARVRKLQEEVENNSTNSATEPPEDDDDVDKTNPQKEDTVAVVNDTVAVRPITYLNLPTSSQHVSEKVLSEALMLQQGEKIIEKVNITVAAQDAATSSKALSEASAAVTAMFNDPNSIEARTCCTSILNVYHENCSVDEEEEYSDSRLFFIVLVMALCGMVKSIIRHYKILWLPEAAGCIIVGVLSGYGLALFPHHDISFDGNWFLRIMVPPIVFEAALSIDKRSFHRHLVPIMMYAVIGTLMATVLTAFIVHKGSLLLHGWCSPIPYVEALTFGALISSIDPIAVLSVLSNMGMTDTDTIYVVIFGESLLNDGVAIVLFQTLVHFLDESLVIDGEAVLAGTIHFLVVAFGSLGVGVASGMVSTVYFWAFQGCQTSLVEILMFVCWALLPYYVCDGIGWSGIVSAVAAGIIMDLYIVGQNHTTAEEMVDTSDSDNHRRENETIARDAGWRRIFTQAGQLSAEARVHIHFVTEMIATMMETAIFAYLGLFLFSHRYHWNAWHTVLAIAACCISRAIMIPTISSAANWIVRFHQRKTMACRNAINGTSSRKSNPTPVSAGVVIDRRMQLVLWFAGLRGAMSFALVEHIPLYDSVSQEGTRLKPELKAMTSACIMFTVFVLGGYTYYMMDLLGLAPNTTIQQRKSAVEMVPLIDNIPSSVSSVESAESSNIGIRGSISKKAVRRVGRSNGVS